jgi:hypothetical protein
MMDRLEGDPLLPQHEAATWSKATYQLFTALIGAHKPLLNSFNNFMQMLLGVKCFAL